MKQGLTYDDVLIEPGRSIVHTRKNILTRSRISKRYSIDVPILAANMPSVINSDTMGKLNNEGASGVMHRFDTNKNRLSNARTLFYEIRIHAVGLKDSTDMLNSLARYSKILLLDVANAYSDMALTFTKEKLLPLKKKYPKLDIIVGNIATSDAAEEYCKLGVDGLKVGIGPGAACTTRLMTGCGVPQLTAIIDVYRVAKKYEVPIIADGGINKPADACKAFIAGASVIMMGKELALCADNTAGGIRQKDLSQTYVKKYYGNASIHNKNNKYIEGEGEYIEIDKSRTLKKVISQYKEGLQSMISYVGEKKLEDCIGKQNFIQVTPNVLIENNTRF